MPLDFNYDEIQKEQRKVIELLDQIFTKVTNYVKSVDQVNIIDLLNL